MEKIRSTNSNGIFQMANIMLCNSQPIIKLFFLILYPKYHLFIHHPINHLDIYVKNYINNTHNYCKYTTMIHHYENKKNLKNFKDLHP